MLGSVRHLSRLALFPIVLDGCRHSASRPSRSARPLTARPRRSSQAHRLAPRHPPESRAGKPRVPHLRPGCRAPEEARLRGAREGRPHRRGGRAQGRQAGSRRGAARRHGCAAGHRGGRPAVRLEGAHQLARQGDGRDARLRPRCPHGHPDGRRRGVRQDAQRTARHGEAHLPARRGRPSARRGGRSAAHDQARACSQDPGPRSSSACTWQRPGARGPSTTGPAPAWRARIRSASR